MLLIQQLTSTRTPKYNFPQPTMVRSLPQRLMELSIHSLKHTQNQAIQLNQQIFHQKDNQEPQIRSTGIKRQPITLTPRKDDTVVAAVDTASIKLGETSRGLLVAVRGAMVWKQKRNYRYFRVGPFIFNVTEENKKEVYHALHREYFISSLPHVPLSSPGLLQMPTRIASLLERWLQAKLSTTISDGLILFDGSLTSGVPGASTRRMKTILENARKRKNVVLAFSKMTNLRFNGYLITDLLLEYEPPYLFEVVGLNRKSPVVLLGDVYVARLGKRNYAFRLDMDKKISIQQRVEGIEKLLGNDLFSQSYPESLRLAHILCTFTANEVIAMQHFIACKYNLKIINRPDIHKLLFGPFGKGETHP